jgi:hypothetical protein
MLIKTDDIARQERGEWDEQDPQSRTGIGPLHLSEQLRMEHGDVIEPSGSARLLGAAIGGSGIE